MLNALLSPKHNEPEEQKEIGAPVIRGKDVGYMSSENLRDHLSIGIAGAMIDHTDEVMDQMTNGLETLLRVHKFMKQYTVIEEEYYKKMHKLVSVEQSSISQIKDRQHDFVTFWNTLVNMLSSAVKSREVFRTEITEKLIDPITESIKVFTAEKARSEKEFKSLQEGLKKKTEDLASFKQDAVRAFQKLEDYHQKLEAEKDHLKQEETDALNLKKTTAASGRVHAMAKKVKSHLEKTKLSFAKYEESLTEMNDYRSTTFHVTKPALLQKIEDEELKRIDTLNKGMTSFCESLIASNKTIVPLGETVHSKASQMDARKSCSKLIKEWLGNFPLSNHKHDLHNEIPGKSVDMEPDKYQKFLNPLHERPVYECPPIYRVMQEWQPVFQSDVKLPVGAMVRVICKNVQEHQHYPSNAPCWFGELLEGTFPMGTFPSSCLSPDVMPVFEEMPLLYLLHMPEPMQMFEKYLDSEYSGENMQFWAEVWHYRTSTYTIDPIGLPAEVSSLERMAELRRKARRIAAKYVSETATRQVNIDGECEGEIMYHMYERGRIDYHTFLAAELSILKLLETDSYSRFSRSPVWREYCQNLVKRFPSVLPPPMKSLRTSTGAAFELGKIGICNEKCQKSGCDAPASIFCITHFFTCKNASCFHLAPTNQWCMKHSKAYQKPQKSGGSRGIPTVIGTSTTRRAGGKAHSPVSSFSGSLGSGSPGGSPTAGFRKLVPGSAVSPVSSPTAGFRKLQPSRERAAALELAATLPESVLRKPDDEPPADSLISRSANYLSERLSVLELEAALSSPPPPPPGLGQVDEQEEEAAEAPEENEEEEEPPPPPDESEEETTEAAKSSSRDDEPEGELPDMPTCKPPSPRPSKPNKPPPAKPTKPPKDI